MRTPKALVSVILMTLAALGGVAAAGGQSATATISGTAYTFNTRNVMVGATISAVEFPDVSTTTASDGSYTLAFPVGTEVTLRIEAAGHASIRIQTFTLDDQHEGTMVVGANFQTPSTAVYDGLYALLASYVGGDPFDGGCAVVTTVGVSELKGMPFEEFIRFAPHGAEGATASLNPPLAQPIYFNSSVVPDLAQTATSNDGGVIWPRVPPGQYVLSAAHPTLEFTTATVRCEPGEVVNANPVWGLHAIDPPETTTTTTVDTTITVDITSTTLGPSPTTGATGSTGSTTTSTAVPTSEPAATTSDPQTSTSEPSSSNTTPVASGSGRDRPEPPGPDSLPRTGADSKPVVASALALLLGGLVLVSLNRRLHRSA